MVLSLESLSMLSSDCYSGYETCRPSFIKKKTIKLEYNSTFFKVYLIFILFTFKALSNRQSICELWGDNLS